MLRPTVTREVSDAKRVDCARVLSPECAVPTFGVRGGTDLRRGLCKLSRRSTSQFFGVIRVGRQHSVPPAHATSAAGASVNRDDHAPRQPSVERGRCRLRRKPVGRTRGWLRNEVRSPEAPRLARLARWWVAGSGRNLSTGPVKNSLRRLGVGAAKTSCRSSTTCGSLR